MAYDLFERMMNSTKLPCVLRLGVIKKKEPGKLMFVFEGDDDYDFYFNAIKSCGFDRDYTHVNGKGKDQSLTLYKELLEEGNTSLSEIFFFVDQDYSEICHTNSNVMTLPLYSIENFLSERKVIEHFLKSTFSLDETYNTFLNTVMGYYDSAKDSFYSGIKEISKDLYLSRILGLDVEFPSFFNIVESIEKDSVKFKMQNIPTINKIRNTLSQEYLELYNTIGELDKDQITRGKYVHSFLSEWLMKIKKYINEEIEKQSKNSTTAMQKKKKNTQFNHTDLSIRHLSVGCSKIELVDRFIKNIN